MTSPLQATSEQVADAEANTESGLRELIAVREIAQAFFTAERSEEVFQLALDRVCPLVGAAFACVYLVEEGTDLMQLAAVYNWPQRFAKFLRQMRVRIGQGPSGRAASERRMIEVLDVFADPSTTDWQEAANELRINSFVALPLQTSTAVIGTVTFYFASPNAVVPETRDLMRVVADQMAASVEKTRLIGDLRQANDALLSSNAALARQFKDVVEARRIKDEFLSNISHELRTPLTAVIGYISLMQEGIAGPVSPEQRHTLEQVKDSSDTLLRLIEDLLDLTALKGGGIEALIDAVDPRDPLRDALADAKGKRDDVALEVEQPEIVPLMQSDRRTAARVLRVLLDNAFKFTRAGSVRAVVRVAGNRVTYTVQDTGIGIPREAHELVFEEFRQVDGTMTREFNGSGVGLALARRMARLIHGEITLASTLGVGSTFTLELPLRWIES